MTTGKEGTDMTYSPTPTHLEKARRYEALRAEVYKCERCLTYAPPTICHEHQDKKDAIARLRLMRR